MCKIPIFVLYDGKWDETTKKFVDNKCTGIVIEKNINYTELLEKLYSVLELNPTQSKIVLKIDTSIPVPCSSPYMDLSNDNDIQFFLSLNEKDNNRCPLYVSIVGPEYSKKNPPPSVSSGGSNNRFSRIPLKEKQNIEQEAESKSKVVLGDRCGGNGSSNGNKSFVKDGNVGNGVKRFEDIKVGDLFWDKDTLKKKIYLIGMVGNFKIRIVRSTAKILEVGCLDEQCMWKVYAGRLSITEFFEVRTYDNVHTCDLDAVRGKYTGLSGKRNKKPRILLFDDEDIVRKCGKCGKPGHNRRNCKLLFVILNFDSHFTLLLSFIRNSLPFTTHFDLT
ncbi:uncharacterized protein LOC115695414 isoform X1 [Cannabis sativa]|uniref:uncharacterized protein LOC115695414 isoform X1 n=1 Tax=Cannabis sativa TaxID=3483 RepID=UPI0029CA0BAC|nr:uncharacterized protein LOC115695414 isoform X1 [Cannabis sativa]